VSHHDIASVRSVFNSLQVLAFLPLFWLLFDSQGSVWVFQRKHMDNCIGPVDSPHRVCLTPELLGGLNPLFVLLVVPLCDGLLFPCLYALRRPALEPTPLRRLGAGMQFTAASFALSALVQHWIDASPPGSVSVLWQLPQYFVMAVGETLVTVTGLEWAYDQAPVDMRGTVMALYMLMVALGNIIGGVVFQFTDALSQLGVLIVLTAAMSVAGVLLSMVACRYRRVDLSSQLGALDADCDTPSAAAMDSPFDALTPAGSGDAEEHTPRPFRNEHA